MKGISCGLDNKKRERRGDSGEGCHLGRGSGSSDGREGVHLDDMKDVDDLPIPSTDSGLHDKHFKDIAWAVLALH